MGKLAPSMLSADFNRLGEQIQELEDNGIEVLHIDVMDGQFVPSISFGMPVIASIRKNTRLFFDVHLMISDPIRYIREFVQAGADSITFHVEAADDPGAVLEEIKKYHCRSAISLRPGTPLSEIEPYLGRVDMVLVMSVEPGFGGQMLKPEMLVRLKELAGLREKRGYGFLLEIDGGVKRDNLAEIVRGGADLIVAGTAVFKGEIPRNIQTLKEVMGGAS